MLNFVGKNLHAAAYWNRMQRHSETACGGRLDLHAAAGEICMRALGSVELRARGDRGNLFVRGGREGLFYG